MQPNRACRRFELGDIAKQAAAWDIVERFWTNLAEKPDGGAGRKPWNERRGKSARVFAQIVLIWFIPACRRSLFRCPAGRGAIHRCGSLRALSRRSRALPTGLLSSPPRLSRAALFLSVWPSPPRRRSSASWRRTWTSWRRRGRRRARAKALKWTNELIPSLADYDR
jgi:hypothetical protein